MTATKKLLSTLMANKEHLSILKQGVKVWNKWRKENPDVRPNLCGANLRETKLHKADLFDTDLRWAKLRGVDLSGAGLIRADLTEAELTEARLGQANLLDANLIRADLSGADLTRAFLFGANLSEARLIGTNLSNAALQRATLVDTDLTRANLSQCSVFGISAWKLKLESTIQTDLIITDLDEAIVTVDNLEVAQFIYLLLHNEKLRDVITTIANKAVLILGRFSDDKRKEILEALRNRIRAAGYLPIIFDFEKAQERDFTETIKILAGMALFVIADITNPKSTPLELQATVPDYMVPFVPILQEGENAFSMFGNLQTKYHWVMEIRRYNDKEHLINHFESGIIRPALELHKQLLSEKNQTLKSKSIDEF